MMTDQHLPFLEAAPVLTEMPLYPHMLNGDVMQQMILVQVNPGETFTVHTDDGQLQCITGPAQVPMVSPNGTVPPIFVPPGYISQVVEENGMWKVLVLPHTLEFHSSLPRIPAHLPLYSPPHPATLHHPYIYPAEVAPHYIHQLPALPVYTEQDVMCHSLSMPLSGEQAVKMQEQLQRTLKSGHLGATNFMPITQNRHSKVQMGLAASATPPRLKHSVWKGRTSPGCCESKVVNPEEEIRRLQDLLSTIHKPSVGSVMSHSAVLSWRPPLPATSEVDQNSHSAWSLSYELVLSQSDTEGQFKLVYQGKDTSCAVSDLRPATLYHARVCVVCRSMKGAPSESVTFTTLCSPPDPPAAPRVLLRTHSSISLQWESPCDNGSKLTGFTLEYHEDKQSAFKEIYSGLARHYRLPCLAPSTTYTFRLAAKNHVGMSAFSAVLSCCTMSSASRPGPPPAPRLTEAGATWLSLDWNSSGESSTLNSVSYMLEMEETGSGCGFRLKYSGEEPSCTVRELRPVTSYSFRVSAVGPEGHSAVSEVVEYRTQPSRPGPPGKPSLHRSALPHSLHLIWECPEDDGGSAISQYVLELSQTEQQWDVVYSGPLRQHVCEGLQEGRCYQLRVYCHSSGGQSPVSETLFVQTPPLPPGPCQALCPVGGATSTQITLSWGAPLREGDAVVDQYCVLMASSSDSPHQQVFRGSDHFCTISHLCPGTTYCFWVKACNPAGWGPLSEVCQCSTAAAPPEQCRVPALTRTTADSVLATWPIPACNGAEVREFRLQWGSEAESLQALYSGATPQYEVRDLQPATQYYCRVQAVNAVGEGLFSDVATVMTAAAAPAAVEHVEQVQEEPSADDTSCIGTSSVALRWTEPLCHGAEIINYKIDISEELHLSVGRTNYHLLENLQPDTTYRIRVQAVNSVGSGPFSPVLEVRTRALPPEPPVLECVGAGPQTLKLRWGEVERPRNSQRIRYSLHLQSETDRSVCIYSGPCRTFKVQRLCEATEYQFSIQAQSEAGMGPLSHPYTFSTTRSPPSQLRAPKVERLEWNRFAVTWEALQAMKGDSSVYILQVLKGREVEQLYKGFGTSFMWHNSTGSATCRLRVCAGRRCQDGSELWGQCSLSTAVSTADTPKERKNSNSHPHPLKKSWTGADEPFATVLLLGFVVLAILFAVIIQYFIIEVQ